MKKTVYFMMLLFLTLFAGTCTANAEKVSMEDMEDVLISQFHPQISQSIRSVYHVRLPQFENAYIVSIEKAALPEPSEEMKPGIEYEITLKVTVLNVPRNANSLLITLSNSQSSGEFVVKQVKKG
ncbi:DUF3888 domain-containing protein [Pseudobacillus badius]|uniref:DUF3888 domain-containing protein n=2 Tax=Bacillus badius TaxID=1455 RepID=UPI002557C311|nr:DUF3888 domain-containing protein [Bacillus badius]UAT30165.1 DUF3888 domain-containing protein [Bacillus badius]